MSGTQSSVAKSIQLSPPKLFGRLAVMMFLQYFVQGAYLPIASVYVERTLGFSSVQVGVFVSMLALGPILAPFIVGQLVDRFFATERVMAACHFVGGILMLLLSIQTSVMPVIVLATAYSILYVPTMMLTNSLAFQHLRDGEVEFPWIRLCGTMGFIAPAYIIEFWWLRGLTGTELDQARAFAFTLSGIVGIAMGVYCLTLPHTPPERKKHDYAPWVVVRMLANRDFLVLVAVSFLIAIAHQFVVVWYGPFMRNILDLGNWGAYEQSISSLGQICEVFVLLLLGLSIKLLGFKRVMLLGTCAYLARCLLFAAAFYFDTTATEKVVLAAVGQSLHGFCFGCFMAVGYMYVDRIAPTDVRGSMQTLYGVFVLSLGFFVGGFVGGVIGDVFSTTVGVSVLAPGFYFGGVTASVVGNALATSDATVTIRDWTSIWLSCAAICAACVLLFGLFFPRRDPSPAEKQ